MKSFYKILAILLVIVSQVSCNKEEDTSTAVIEEYLVDPSLVETKPIEKVSINTAIAGVTIKKNEANVVLKGICWGIAPNPNVNKNDVMYYTGTFNTFDLSLLDLKENTTYYVRAFVKISSTFYYGNEVTFTTKALEKIYTEGAGVTDVDGNEYKTVVLGTQEWMAENLRTTKFNDGSEITTGIWRHDSNEVNKIYGAYYNWDNINSTKKICPTGWRVPKAIDFDGLIKYVDPVFFGTKNVAAIKLKSSGYVENSTGLWRKTDASVGGTNESGFNAVPAASFSFGANDFLLGIGYESIFWTADSNGAATVATAVTYYISNYSDQVTKQFADKKLTGLSCRCIKE